MGLNNISNNSKKVFRICGHFVVYGGHDDFPNSKISKRNAKIKINTRKHIQ